MFVARANFEPVSSRAFFKTPGPHFQFLRSHRLVSETHFTFMLLFVPVFYSFSL
jgi:hypothetical protein